MVGNEYADDVLTRTEEKQRSWPRIAVVGAGAVGGYFGGLLALAGAPVVLVGRRKALIDAIKANGLVIDRATGSERIKIEATTEIGAIQQVELVLFCVKSNDTVSAAQEMAPFVSENAIVVSLQNGVDNADKIRDATKIDALPASVYVGVSVPKPGFIKHVGRGDIVLGPESERTKWAREIFIRAQIPCRITDNIDGEMWIKLLRNCVLNAISALGHVRYKQIAENADARVLMQTLVDEVLAVAKAANVVLPGISGSQAGMEAAMQIAREIGEAFSSTAQDLQRGRASEIDSLNGYIARRGAELGVPVPVNHALFTLVKLVEQSFSG